MRVTTKWQGMRGLIKNAEFHVAVDYGVKENILRSLELAGCRLTVFPTQILKQRIASLLIHDGIFLSMAWRPSRFRTCSEEKMFGETNL